MLDIKNVNSHSLGVVATDADASAAQCDSDSAQHAACRSPPSACFARRRPGRNRSWCRLSKGESASPDDCSQIGRCVVRDLPADLPAQTPIEVRFSYQENGRLTVNVLVAGTRQELRHEITRDNTMNQQQLDAWRLFVTGQPGEGSSVVPSPSASQVLPGEITIVTGDSMIGPSESSILRGEPPVIKTGHSSIISGDDDIGTDEDLQIIDE